MKCKLTVLVIFLMSLSAFSQSRQEFSVEELREDFRIFQGSLEDFHPGLYWYRSEKEINAYFDSVKLSIKEPLSLMEYFRLISKATGYIGCGHTWTDPPNAEERNLRLPLKLWFTDSEAICLENNSEDSLAIRPGDQILSVNNYDVKSILKLSKQILPGSDGYTVSGSMAYLNNYFHYVFPTYFEYSSQYNIRIITQSGTEKTVTLKALPFSEIKKNAQNRYNKQNDPRNLILDFRPNKSTAILQVSHFFDWKEGKRRVKFEKRLQELFESLDSAKVKNLVIDVRNNSGGKVPWVLYSYFVDESFLFANSADFIFHKSSTYYPYQKLHPNMKFLKRKWLHTWLPGSSKMSKVDSNRHELTGLYMTKPFKPSSPQFAGNVYIMVNGGTFSAASDFAAMMKSAELATIIGVETGGGYYGNTSMQDSYVTLPNTKILLGIPLVRHQLNVNENIPIGRGVIPDHEVEQSIADLINGVDTQMEFVLELLKKTSR